MKTKKLKIWKILGLSVLGLCVQAGVLFGILVLWMLFLEKDFEGCHYRTEDVADYGYYPEGEKFHWSWSEYPPEFIAYVLPPKIEDYFSDVQYVCKAEGIADYEFEAYLEFTIEDRVQYEAYLRKVLAGRPTQPFYFDNAYQEYVVCDFFRLDPYDSTSDKHVMDAALIGKFLFCDEEQRIIYVAMGLADGGGGTVERLSTYFPRFGIDPDVYAEQADQHVVPNAKVRERAIFE